MDLESCPAHKPDFIRADYTRRHSYVAGAIGRLCAPLATATRLPTPPIRSIPLTNPSQCSSTLWVCWSMKLLRFLILHAAVGLLCVLLMILVLAAYLGWK